MIEIQRAILRTIQEYTVQHGYGPSMRDIREAVGISSNGHLTYHLEILQVNGYITRDARVARSIRIIKMPGKEAA